MYVCHKQWLRQRQNLDQRCVLFNSRLYTSGILDENSPNDKNYLTIKIMEGLVQIK
jgi:hypothetical protein